LISFKQDSSKIWRVVRNNNSLIKLELSTTSITNKFFIITDFLKRLSKEYKDEFDDWFMNLILSCKESDFENYYNLIFSNLDKMKYFIDNFSEIKDLDMSKFVDESKAKKSSILFSEDEIEKIIKLSGYLKIYSIISNSDNLKLPHYLHKKIYNELAKDITNSQVIYKIFNVIKTKTFRYNLTDKYMWTYIKTIQCKTIDDHIIEIFNFIMNNIIILCDGRNPITYFVGVIDESIKWFLRSVYKGSVIYEDSISTEDIQGLDVNNLRTYAYNDTLGRLKGIAYEQIYDKLERDAISKIGQNEESSDELITDFQNRVSDVEYISPICETLAFPILSRITNIPYNHFKTVSPEQAAVLSVYVYNLLKKVFSNEFKNLFSLLDYYPITQPSITTTYLIKSVNEYINIQQKTRDFYGFSTKILPYKIICNFVGRISRIDFSNTVTGKRMVGIPLSKIEVDSIEFYTLYFGSKLESEINELRRLMNIDF